MESYWILGAGRFGSLAMTRILEKKGPQHLVVVDREARSLKHLRVKAVEIFKEDAIEFLSKHPGFGDEWIVPAIPVHVAFAWLCRQLATGGRVTPISAPSIIDHQVPNPLRDRMGGICTSIAAFRCPDDCEEPSWMCTVTGKQRETDIFDLIPRIQVKGFITRVVRSHQLAPGVGGYRLSVLWSLLEEVRSTEKDFLIATACRCHGVINALRWYRTQDQTLDTARQCDGRDELDRRDDQLERSLNSTSRFARHSVLRYKRSFPKNGCLMFVSWHRKLVYDRLVSENGFSRSLFCRSESHDLGTSSAAASGGRHPYSRLRCTSSG